VLHAFQKKSKSGISTPLLRDADTRLAISPATAAPSLRLRVLDRKQCE
jgi:hypothetical protein